MNEFIKIRGTIEFFAEKDGEIVNHWIEDNLIVNLGRQTICQLLATGNVQRVVNTLGFGTGQITAAVTDTSLTDSFTKNVGSSITYPSETQIRWDWSLETGEGNGAGTVSYYEMGLLTNNGTLFSRKVRAEMVKNASTRFFGTWTLNF